MLTLGARPGLLEGVLPRLGGSVGPVSQLTAPSLVGAVKIAASSGSSLTSDPFSPAVDDLVLLFRGSRKTSTGTFLAPTTTAANAAFTALGGVGIGEEEGNNGSVWIRAKAWLLKFTGAPGAGVTVSSATSASVLQSVMALATLRGHDPLATLLQSIASQNSASTTFASDPSPLSLVMSLYWQQANSSPLTLPTGHSLLSEANVSTQAHYAISWRLTNAIDRTLTFGGGSGPRAIVSFEIKSA